MVTHKHRHLSMQLFLYFLTEKSATYFIQNETSHITTMNASPDLTKRAGYNRGLGK